MSTIAIKRSCASASRERAATPASESLPLQILATVMALSGVGLVMIYSASAISGQDPLTQADSFAYVKRQLLALIPGAIAMMLIARSDYRRLAKFSPVVLAAVLVLLVLVLVPSIGHVSHGARRWIRFGGFGLQPSEFLKPALILFAAGFVTRSGPRLGEFRRGFLPSMGIVLVSVGLVVAEPDLGTGLFILAVSSTVFIVGGVKLRHVLPVVALAIPVVLFTMLSHFDYIQGRLESFRSGEPHYHVKQSLVALGSGGVLGQGLGAGRQKLYFLPEKSSDFIFAVLGEELGFAGSALVVVLYVALLALGFRAALRAPDLCGFLIAFGVSFAIALQAVMNIAVVTGSVPTKGISLPFISLGGSSLLSTFLSVGLLLSVARRATEADS